MDNNKKRRLYAAFLIGATLMLTEQVRAEGILNPENPTHEVIPQSPQSPEQPTQQEQAPKPAPEKKETPKAPPKLEIEKIQTNLREIKPKNLFKIDKQPVASQQPDGVEPGDDSFEFTVTGAIMAQLSGKFLFGTRA
ncbi:MAG: hypothetical protein LBV67_09330 [Streptococcaceae bacterium]|jgi:outer membrane biosynthesis protein TonB|nr:hypothetical protein [Streptococcaceae bacterium]